MKCKLKQGWKDFFKFLLGIIIIFSLISLGLIFIGYLMVHWFDACWYSGEVSTIYHYYIWNGFGFVLVITLIITIGLLIIGFIQDVLIPGLKEIRRKGLLTAIRDIFLECD